LIFSASASRPVLISTWRCQISSSRTSREAPRALSARADSESRSIASLRVPSMRAAIGWRFGSGVPMVCAAHAQAPSVSSVAVIRNVKTARFSMAAPSLAAT
jgi:hypothetical protein